MTTKYYTGFGSRRMPVQHFPLCRAIARALELAGYVLRSGGAKGADLAFESGVLHDSAKQIFLPSEPIPRVAFELAAEHHPAWSSCSGYARRCHARNSLQVLGPDLRSPSRFGVCWTPGAAEIGGSAQTMRIARAHDVPIFNIADRAQLEDFLQTYLPEHRSFANK